MVHQNDESFTDIGSDCDSCECNNHGGTGSLSRFVVIPVALLRYKKRVWRQCRGAERSSTVVVHRSGDWIGDTVEVPFEFRITVPA